MLLFVLYFVFFGFCFFGVLLEGLRVKWGGPKGHLTWPYTLLIYCFFFWGGGLFFLYFLCFLIQQKPCFSLRKGQFLFIFECLPLFLPSLFWPPPFFNSSFSVSLLFLSFFLPSYLSFLLSFGSLFLSLSFLFFLLCFCFMKGTTSKY